MSNLAKYIAESKSFVEAPPKILTTMETDKIKKIHMLNDMFDEATKALEETQQKLEESEHSSTEEPEAKKVSSKRKYTKKPEQSQEQENPEQQQTKEKRKYNKKPKTSTEADTKKDSPLQESNINTVAQVLASSITHENLSNEEPNSATNTPTKKEKRKYNKKPKSDTPNEQPKLDEEKKSDETEQKEKQPTETQKRKYTRKPKEPKKSDGGIDNVSTSVEQKEHESNEPESKDDIKESTSNKPKSSEQKEPESKEDMKESTSNKPKSSEQVELFTIEKSTNVSTNVTEQVDLELEKADKIVENFLLDKDDHDDVENKEEVLLPSLTPAVEKKNKSKFEGMLNLGTFDTRSEMYQKITCNNDIFLYTSPTMTTVIRGPVPYEYIKDLNKFKHKWNQCHPTCHMHLEKYYANKNNFEKTGEEYYLVYNKIAGWEHFLR
jgi:hypothetical protein